MKIVETSTGKEYLIEIEPVKNNEFKNLTKERYFFDWKTERNQEVYKLRIKGTQDALGLVSFERIPEEWRLHIRLLTVSKENKGRGKQFDRIAGNLITHVAKLALLEYGELACVSLRPKSQIARHYIETFKMNVTGITLSLEVPGMLDLIKLYDHD